MLKHYVRIGLNWPRDDLTAIKAEQMLVGFNDNPNRTFAHVLDMCAKVAGRPRADAADAASA